MTERLAPARRAALPHVARFSYPAARTTPFGASRGDRSPHGHTAALRTPA
ncbi:hypothetical protein ACFPM0_09670 [Pseudonocardia sulfidoxydans]